MSKFIPKHFVLDKQRLPVAIPATVNEAQNETLSKLGFVQGMRHYQYTDPSGTRQLSRLFPIPIHQDIPVEVLEQARDILEQ